MAPRKMIAQIALALFIPSFLVPPASTQAKRAKYPLTKFDNYGCMAKGRVQDCRGKVMEQILADGKDAISILISQLTETAVAENQIADIGPLAKLTKLQYINLAKNQIANFQAVKDLTSLSALDLSSNKGSDLTPLEGLPKLVAS